MLSTETINILSQLNATLEWENTGSVGTILIDETSDLYVRANLTTSTFQLEYELISGTLPPGLTLERDGTIKGRPSVYTISSSTNTYNFNVRAKDSTGYNYLEGDFSVTTISTSTAYTDIYFKPYLNLNKRKEFSDFVNDKTIFTPSYIYRPFDSNFGVQLEMKLILHFGVEIKSVFQNYIDILEKNFKKRKIYLGELKTAIAKKDNDAIYEVIYVEAIDQLNPLNVINTSTSTSFVFNNVNYYPASIENMRSRFINNNTNVDTKEDRNYKFLDTRQSNGFLSESGYIPYVPICYCIPGKSNVILNRIKKYGFEFNKINFEIDRLLIRKNNRDVPDISRYLLFKNRN